MIVKNLTKNVVLSRNALLADTPFSRMCGLLGRDEFQEGEALIITHCNSIHMFFMKFPIDAMFLDAANRVVGDVRNIKPFQLSPIFWTAKRVIELPTGTLASTATSLGDRIEIA
jgi:uncharacterized membrane protein (UPF0127 family)